PFICWMLERSSVVRRRFRTGEIHHKLRLALEAGCVASSITLPKSCFVRYAVSAEMPSRQFGRRRRGMIEAHSQSLCPFFGRRPHCRRGRLLLLLRAGLSTLPPSFLDPWRQVLVFGHDQ